MLQETCSVRRGCGIGYGPLAEAAGATNHPHLSRPRVSHHSRRSSTDVPPGRNAATEPLGWFRAAATLRRLPHLTDVFSQRRLQPGWRRVRRLGHRLGGSWRLGVLGQWRGIGVRRRLRWRRGAELRNSWVWERAWQHSSAAVPGEACNINNCSSSRRCGSASLGPVTQQVTAPAAASSPVCATVSLRMRLLPAVLTGAGAQLSWSCFRVG